MAHDAPSLQGRADRSTSRQEPADVIVPVSPRKQHSEAAARVEAATRESVSRNGRASLALKSARVSAVGSKPSAFVERSVNILRDQASRLDGVRRGSGEAAEGTMVAPVVSGGAPNRDEHLQLCEEDDLESRRGPLRFSSLEEDPHFERYEPYSGTRMKSRTLPHNDLDNYMVGRVHIPPSLLYSIVRNLAITVPILKMNRPSVSNDIVTNVWQGKGSYEVPVSGDWVTIAVLVEKGPIRVTKGRTSSNTFQKDTSSTIHHDGGVSDEDSRDDGSVDGDEDESGPSRRRQKSVNEMPGECFDADASSAPRKFMSYKLIDLGSNHSPRHDSDVSPRGDAVLNLLLFEADPPKYKQQRDHDSVTLSKKKIFRGGSGGAFEMLAKEREGTLIAITNPRVLPPRKGHDSRGETLTVTPTSSHNVTIIGRAADFSNCEAIRKDGHRCSSFVDRRSSVRVCEWHLAKTFERNRRGRQEFANTTNGGPLKGTRAPAIRDLGRKGGRVEGGIGTHAPRPYVVEGPDANAHVHGEVSENLRGIARRRNLKSSNPESIHFDVTSRMGRGQTEKEARRKRQADDDDLQRQLAHRDTASGDARSGKYAVSDKLAWQARNVKREEYELLSHKRRHDSSDSQPESDQIHKRKGRRHKGRSREQSEHSSSDSEANTELDLKRAERRPRDEAGHESDTSGDSEVREAKKVLKRYRLSKKAKRRAAVALPVPSFSRRPENQPSVQPYVREDRETATLESRRPGQQPVKQEAKKAWSHSAEEIKLMGWDPLSGTRNQRQDDKDQKRDSDIRSRLLARHNANPADLTEATFEETKVSKRRSNVRVPSGAKPLTKSMKALKAMKAQNIARECDTSAEVQEDWMADSDLEEEVLRLAEAAVVHGRGKMANGPRRTESPAPGARSDSPGLSIGGEHSSDDLIIE